MTPFSRCWADLPPELLCHIGDQLDLKGYTGARGTALSPTLLVFDADEYLQGDRWCRRRYALSLPTRRSLELTAFVSGARCVGSSNGWLALSVLDSWRHNVFVLFNPVASQEIVLPSLIYDSHWVVSKIVFTPPCHPKDDFAAAAAICARDRIAYVTAGARRWVVTDSILSTNSDHLTDVVVYNDNGNAAVYCLTQCGDVHVLRLSDCRTTYIRSLLSEISQGPDLNFPATVEPLLSEANLPFNPATVFAPPYDTMSPFFSAKNLVFCEGNLYQVWRNKSCTVTLHLPGGGGRRRVAEHEVLVLRYYPEQQPCWDAVKDLGGHSFFCGEEQCSVDVCRGCAGTEGQLCILDWWEL